MLVKTQLCWAGHVSRMKDYHLPKIDLHGELASGHRTRGASKKRYKDALKKRTRVHATSDPLSGLPWKRTVALCDTPLKELLKPWKKFAEPPYKRRNRGGIFKDKAAVKPTPNETFSCRHYKRAFLSRIGLISNERACRRRGQLS